MSAKLPIALILLPLLAACAGAKEGSGLGPEGQGVSKADPSRPEAAAGEWTKEYDLNRDQVPDVYQHYVKGADGTDTLVRKDMDINMDGRIDIWRYYDEKERLAKEALDLDFDGRIDVVNVYDASGALIRKESDLDFDGQPDLFKHYEAGKLARKERDTSGNGRIDYFEYYEDGAIDRIGEDLDGDGSVDRWTKAQQ